jgi:methyltransferase (TIGR00027 family)
MADPQPVIRHISDTARWAAVYRARETERPDAVFRDPLARKLAGERGEEIAKSLPFHEENSWSWIARTVAFDRIITAEIKAGADMVVNLAAGLDARPYRMDLPTSLQWFEVDFPEILEYKEQLLAKDKPHCMLERVKMDLADSTERAKLFEKLGARASKVLIISEGLLIYLTAEEVGKLAEDLAKPPSFRRWVFDIVSPGLLDMLQKGTHSQFTQDVPQLKFAPANGPDFFLPHGWKLVSASSMLKTAAGLKRLRPMLRFFSLFPEKPTKMGKRPWSAACLMERTS